jgi:superfamily II DNA or RNA helicase
MFASPYRMGLKATVEREDGLHAEAPVYIGPLRVGVTEKYIFVK